MKSTFFALLTALMLPIFANAQEELPFPMGTDGYPTWQKLVKKESISRSELYKQTLEYLKINFPTTNGNINIEERDSLIYCRGTMPTTYKSLGFCQPLDGFYYGYTLIFEFKDGRSRITLKLIESIIPGSGGVQTIVPLQLPSDPKSSLYSRGERKNWECRIESVEYYLNWAEKAVTTAGSGSSDDSDW